MSRQIFRSAPGFEAPSTQGPFDFHAEKEGRWALLLSAPFAFTPVCTTELAAVSKRYDEFVARDVLVAAVAVDTVPPLEQWVVDIEAAFGVSVPFALVADADRSIAVAYGMIDVEQAAQVLPVAPGRWLKASPDFAVRTAFVVSPADVIMAAISYPPSVGLSVDEVLRVIDALKLTRWKLAAPADWQDGDDVVVGRVTPDSEAVTRYGNLRTITPYLRTTTPPPYTRTPR
ncbi:redoxin domain-containing protein [Frondihabitans cladoniiphilus]|uniref:Peroxiredoxin n=1 Tax=Frondihabitans cladoniiphilus TaxID=715785 RepID=A0ABP8W6P7_9MICO